MANERSRETAATAERVWSIWSDPATWPGWNPDIETIDVAIREGATGEMRTRSGGRHDIAIQDVTAGRTFTLNSSGIPGHRLHFKCEVVPSGAGSRISQAVTIHGPLSFVFNPMMGGQIAGSFPALLDGLAKASEAAT
jgi:hypothetical protein